MTQGSIAPLRFILPAQLIDLGLSSAHELLNEFWRHQALPEAIEDDPFKCGMAEALTVGAGAAAACSGAGKIVATNRCVMAAALPAIDEATEQVARPPALPETCCPRMGHAEWLPDAL